MSKKQPSQPPPDYGAKRASELLEVFMAFPSYSDDSLFTMTRYHTKAKQIMSKRDHDKFMDAINSLSSIWAASIKPPTPAANANVDVNANASASASIVANGGESQAPSNSSSHAGETLAERAKRMTSVRREAAEAVKDYPELAKSFDNFCMASRAVVRTMGNVPTK